MRIEMDKNAGSKELGYVINRLESENVRPVISRNGEGINICGPSLENERVVKELEKAPGVISVKPFSRPYRLVSREFRTSPTVVEVGEVPVGGETVVLMAGPCAVESRDQLFGAAEAVKKAGAKILRGGAYKPRTSPYSFHGLGEEGLKLLAEARDKFGMQIVTEVVAPEYVDLVADYADLVQVGARNMQNFILLERLGRIDKPVLLKRGMMSTIDELLMSAEYVVAGGNPNVILCERGIRTFEKHTRNTLDLSAVPVLKELTHLPVIVDPSHSTGDDRFVAPMSLAAVAAGADGLIVEAHPCPGEALCDGSQSLTPEAIVGLSEKCANVARAVGRCF